MNLSEATSLYNQGRYLDCIDKCNAIIETKEYSIEVFTLTAKAVIGQSAYPMKDNEKSLVTDCINNAVTFSKSVKEIYDVKYEIEKALQGWRKKAIANSLQDLSNNFCIEQYQKYIDVEFMSSFGAMFISASVKSSNRPDLLEQEGIDEKSALKKYEKSLDDDAFKNEYKQKEFEFAQNTFNNLINYVNSNRVGTAELCQEVSKVALQYTATLDLLCKHFTPDPEDSKLSPETMIERLSLHAQILSYKMDGTLCCYGNDCSFYLGDDMRQETYDEIKALYAKIARYDPTFQAPPMPRLHGIYPQAPVSSSASNSSGGCYVATAVYGSYDCPQVWTLRRYRDNKLAKTWHGRTFIKTYYAISPTLVKWFGETEWFKKMWIGRLDKMVNKLQTEGFESTPYEDINW